MIKRLFNWILSLIERKPSLNDPIEKAFSIAGKGYYQFKDISKMKCNRVLVTNDFYNELTMRATRDFLVKHTEAVEKLLNDSEINIFKIHQLNQQLKERLEMIYETDIIYKIASVVFFTKEENPYEYDDILGQEKVELFRAQGDGFFFGKLFKSLIGSTDLSEKDLKTYMTVGQQITSEHLRNISTILSS